MSLVCRPENSHISDKIERVPTGLQKFPDEQDVHRLSRQWMINIMFTIVGDEIARWVN
jgi:hypothetical protein